MTQSLYRHWASPIPHRFRFCVRFNDVESRKWSEIHPFSPMVHVDRANKSNFYDLYFMMGKYRELEKQIHHVDDWSVLYWQTVFSKVLLTKYFNYRDRKENTWEILFSFLLLHLYLQISTLIQHRSERPHTTSATSERTLRAIGRVGQAVNLAVERFVTVGETIADDNPDIKQDMYDACKEARAAGEDARFNVFIDE